MTSLIVAARGGVITLVQVILIFSLLVVFFPFLYISPCSVFCVLLIKFIDGEVKLKRFFVLKVFKLFEESLQF